MANLEKLITESVNNSLNEMKIKAAIKKMLREYIENEFGDIEEKKSDDKPKKSSKKNDKLGNDERETEELVSSIEDYFKNPGVKQAPFAYKLYGVKPMQGKDTEEMKNARKKFSAKVNHELNDSGYPYQFSPEDAVELKSLISAQELSEVKNWENRMIDATKYE